MEKITAEESLCNFILKGLDDRNIKTNKDLDDINVVTSVVKTFRDHSKTLLIMIIEKMVRKESGEGGFKLTEENLTTAYEEAIKKRKKEILVEVGEII